MVFYYINIELFVYLPLQLISNPLFSCGALTIICRIVTSAGYAKRLIFARPAIAGRGVANVWCGNA